MTKQITTDSSFPAPSAPAFPKMTYAEFLRIIPDDVHAEWVDGEVVLMTPVSSDHNDLSVFLLALLRLYAEARDLGKVFCEPFQMKIGPDLPGRSPDLLFVSKKRLSHVKKVYLQGPADLAVEIISPDSRARDRGEKFYEYEQGGVREYWLLDPARKQAEFYELGKNGIYRLMTVGEDDIFRSQVLKGLWLQVSWLWQSPLPPLMTVLKSWKLI
ncbi:MAG: Uma2 family endonuclease [Acidobacteria bacterium]|nr:Uma2 family endonuclease [Acidobacteriota bacterium]MCI0722088.1 Uma2 family endonuclease [Acidobacteriota bacterium]